MTIIKEVKTISAKNTPHTLAARNGKYVCVDCKRVFFSPNPQTACAGKVETKPQDYMSAAECKNQAVADYLTRPLREVRAELRQMESTLNAWHPWAVEAAREAVKRMEKDLMK